MELNQPFVFQSDSEIVNTVYRNDPNYIIEYNEDNPKDYCIIYFSSHNIYNPNTAEDFERDVLRKNRYEWYGLRLQFGHKHIFIRDIIKQWYLTGINATISDPDKLLAFLKQETSGYKVIMLGSSAGGFASVLYGQLLGAERIYSFNGQFEVNSMLLTSDPSKDPILFRKKDDAYLRPFYDSRSFLKTPATVSYFYSRNSDWDKEQSEYMRGTGINFIGFSTSHHGIPFLKDNLKDVLHLSVSDLSKLYGRSFHPLLFSFRISGIAVTVKALWNVAMLVFGRILSKLLRKKK